MGIRPSMRPVARRRLEQAAFRLLDASTLCAISTISPRATAHVNAAYFAWEQQFGVIWLSDPAARHSRNIRARPTTAVAVHGPSQVWGNPDRGIQLFGSARQLPRRETAPAERLYAARFPQYASQAFRGYRFYRFQARRVKVFDEAFLGSGAFVTARVVARDGLRWERTEISTG